MAGNLNEFLTKLIRTIVIYFILNSFYRKNLKYDARFWKCSPAANYVLYNSVSRHLASSHSLFYSSGIVVPPLSKGLLYRLSVSSTSCVPPTRSPVHRHLPPRLPRRIPRMPRRRAVISWGTLVLPRTRWGRGLAVLCCI